MALRWQTGTLGHVTTTTAPNGVLKSVRMSMRCSQEELARRVRLAGADLGDPNQCDKRLVARWESGEVAAPRPNYVRPLEMVTGLPITALGFPGAEERYGAAIPHQTRPVDVTPGILDSVPPSFPAERLCGYWVTSYEFHPGVAHADVARIEAVSSSQVCAVNFPPEPRTQDRSHTFRNQIQAQLVNRHLAGWWRNLSDTRYFGTFQLAVMPGETVMEGFYTGFANDIEVSMARWKWVRLAEDELPEMTLKEPAVIYQLVMQHSPLDQPLRVPDIGEEI
jgi:transcriptional regulator with XRE-family HTH domain